MRVCILMGSPRLNRNTAELCKPFMDELRLHKVEVDYITLHFTVRILHHVLDVIVVRMSRVNMAASSGMICRILWRASFKRTYWYLRRRSIHGRLHPL